MKKMSVKRSEFLRGKHSANIISTSPFNNSICLYKVQFPGTLTFQKISWELKSSFSGEKKNLWLVSSGKYGVIFRVSGWGSRYMWSTCSAQDFSSEGNLPHQHTACYSRSLPFRKCWNQSVVMLGGKVFLQLKGFLHSQQWHRHPSAPWDPQGLSCFWRPLSLSLWGSVIVGAGGERLGQGMEAMKAAAIPAQRPEDMALPRRPLSSAPKVISQDLGRKALMRTSSGVIFPKPKLFVSC